MTTSSRDVYHFTFRLDAVSPVFGMSHSYNYEHNGNHWRCSVQRREMFLDVGLHATARTTVHTVAIVNGNVVRSVPGVDGNKDGMYKKLISWRELKRRFEDNGVFVIELTINKPETPSVCVPRAGKIVRVCCKDSTQGIHCNSDFLSNASSVMLTAFSNDWSKESIDKEFIIGHDCATDDNVRLLVKAMHNGWIEDEMDDHAAELLVMSDCYGCDSVAAAARISMQRHLTEDNFWHTVSIAVLLQMSQTKLLKRCAEYAENCNGGYNKLLKRADRGTVTTIGELGNAIGNELQNGSHYLHGANNRKRKI